MTDASARSAGAAGANIAEQLGKLERDTDVTSSCNYKVAQRWEKWNMRLGLSIVLVSAAVTIMGSLVTKGTAAGDANYFAIASTLLSSLTTALSSVMTFLKPSERAAEYRECGNKQKMLRNRIRIYRTVELPQEEDRRQAAKQLIRFNHEKDALVSSNPPIPDYAYQLARSEIDEKELRRKRLG